jgi:CheY-like chemotaxis protein
LVSEEWTLSFRRPNIMSREEGGSKDIFAAFDAEKCPLLVMDSDTQNLLYTSKLLQSFAYRTHMAETAQEAFDTATNSPPSLIITALGLADMNGIKLLKMIRTHPLTADIPFIAMRRKEDPLKEQHCFSAGAVHCLNKPISAELLYRAVQSATQKRPRANMRIRTIQPVKIDTMPFADHDVTHTLDLSERGMFLRTSKPAPENTRLFIRINLNGLIISAETVVIYRCSQDSGPYKEPGMGLKFIHIAPKDQELIRQFIGNEVLRGILPEKNSSIN